MFTKGDQTIVKHNTFLIHEGEKLGETPFFKQKNLCISTPNKLKSTND